jgi:hypothetical protein
MIGEIEVRRMLESQGYIVYQPQTEGSHQMDMLAIKDKQLTIAADVKTKARRTHYEDTGVNQKHFELYQQFSHNHNAEFYIFFVDRVLGKIYGNRLSILERPCWHQGMKYPRVEAVKYGRDAGVLIRYWPMCVMQDFGKISKATAEVVRQYEQRNYSEPKESAQVFFDFNAIGGNYGR